MCDIILNREMIKMLSQERQQYIKEEIEKHGAVTTAALTKQLEVSLETIRRDLLILEQNGVLKKVHGGAVRIEPMHRLRKLHRRLEENTDAKMRLAKTAVKYIDENDVIGIDSGSTAVSLARELKGKFSYLTVVTHSLDVFSELSSDCGIRLILCGGEYLADERAFYGSITESVLDGIYINKMFMCPSAISLKFGVCDWQNEMFSVQKKMAERSEMIYALADSSKFETKALLKIGDASSYIYITDGALPNGIRELYAENGLKIITK